MGDLRLGGDGVVVVQISHLVPLNTSRTSSKFAMESSTRGGDVFSQGGAAGAPGHAVGDS